MGGEDSSRVIIGRQKPTMAKGREGGREGGDGQPPSHLGSQAWGGAVGRRQGRAQDLGSGYSKFQVLAKFFFDSSKYTHALIEY